MTTLEHARALALGGCTFAPASFSKRFARDLSAQARGAGMITEKQAARLAVQCFIFRRQMPAAAARLRARGELPAIPPDFVPAQPPPGYATPKQRRAMAA